MQAITTESLAGMLALIGAVIVVAGLLSGLVERSNVPQVGVFLLLGAVLGPYGFGVLEIGLDSPVLRVVATLSLALVLFTDALSLSIAEVRRNARLAAAILGPGTLLAAAIIAAAGHYLLNLSWPLAAILAAPLASTDPVILRGLLRLPGLSPAAKTSLRLESGLNDVVLLPIVLAAMAFAGAGHGVEMGSFLFSMIAGPIAGFAVAAVAIATLVKVRKRIGIRRDYESIYSLGVCFAAFAAAESFHGSGYLAAFGAGIATALQDVELCDCFQEYGETTAEMLLMFTFVLLGASLIWSGMTLVTLGVVAFAVVALAARPVALMATLKPFSIDVRSRRIIAWFGPRGLSTLLLVLVPVFGGTPGAPRLFEISSVVVLVSVVLHGGTIMLYGRRMAAACAGSPKGLTPERLRERLAAGEEVRLLDVRSLRTYDDSPQELEGALRLDPSSPVSDAERLALPKTTPLALFCACPSEETSEKVASALRGAGWLHAEALVGGWDALLAAGFPTVPKGDV
jgi:NhaP-type Na+/H+ or K+/H+ antiporter